MSVKQTTKPEDGGLSPSNEFDVSVSDTSVKIASALRKFSIEWVADPVLFNGMVNIFTTYVEIGIVSPEIIIDTLEEIFCERSIMITLACYKLLQNVEMIMIKKRLGL